MYILWSPRLQGWFTRSHTYSSDQAEAKQLTRDEALALARKHKNQGGYNLLPVRLEDLEAI